MPSGCFVIMLGITILSEAYIYFKSKSVVFSKHAILLLKLWHYGCLQMFSYYYYY